MAAEAGTPHRTASTLPIPLHRRLYGFGSIYGKTIRDSRLAFIIAAGMLGGLALVMGAAIGTVFPTPAARLEVNKLIGSMPAPSSVSAPPSGRSLRSPGLSPARRRAAASTSSPRGPSASAGSPSRSWPPT